MLILSRPVLGTQGQCLNSVELAIYMKQMILNMSADNTYWERIRRVRNCYFIESGWEHISDKSDISAT